MNWLLGIAIGIVVYVVFSLWMIKRVVAWNVVMAALTLRRMTQEECHQVELSVVGMLGRHNLSPSAFYEASVPVKYAYLSLALLESGVPAFDPVVPFRWIRKPIVANAARRHIDIVRRKCEVKYGVALPELAAASGTGQREA